MARYCSWSFVGALPAFVACVVAPVALRSLAAFSCARVSGVEEAEVGVAVVPAGFEDGGGA